MAEQEPQPQSRPFHVKLAQDVPLVGNTLRVIVDAWQRTRGRNWIFWVYLSTLDIAMFIIWRVICNMCPGVVEQTNCYACRKLDELKNKYPSITLPRRQVTRQFQKRCWLSPAGLCGRILALALKISFRAVTLPALFALRVFLRLVDLAACVITLPVKVAATLVLVLVVLPIVDLVFFCVCLRVFVSMLRFILMVVVAIRNNRNRVVGLQRVPRALRAILRRRRRLRLRLRLRLRRRGPSRRA